MASLDAVFKFADGFSDSLGIIMRKTDDINLKLYKTNINIKELNTCLNNTESEVIKISNAFDNLYNTLNNFSKLKKNFSFLNSALKSAADLKKMFLDINESVFNAESMVKKMSKASVVLQSITNNTQTIINNYVMAPPLADTSKSDSSDKKSLLSKIGDTALDIGTNVVSDLISSGIEKHIEKQNLIKQASKEAGEVSQDAKAALKVDKYTKAVSNVSKKNKAASKVDKYTEAVSNVSKETKAASKVDKYTKAVSNVSKETKAVSKVDKYTEGVSNVSKETKAASKINKYAKTAGDASKDVKMVSKVDKYAKTATEIGKSTKIATETGKYAEAAIEASKFAKVASKAGRAVPIIGNIVGLAGSGLDIATAPKGKRGRVIAGEAGNWLGGLAAGAAAGAGLGALGLNPVTVAVGGAVGGIAGAIGGEKAVTAVYDNKKKIGDWFSNKSKSIADWWNGTKKSQQVITKDSNKTSGVLNQSCDCVSKKNCNLHKENNKCGNACSCRNNTKNTDKVKKIYLAPKISITFGDVHETADVNKIVKRLRVILRDEIATVGEGAH